MAVIFVVSLIPLVYIARFGHPSADDFSYGNHTVHVWRETGSLPQVLSAAVTGTRYVYNTWQGSFVAVFLMTLHPAVFGENLYMFGIAGVILGFVAAMIFFLKVVFMNCLGADKYAFGIIAVLFTFVAMQFVFCPVEGFFWYNSAMYYTGFHSLSLVLFAITLLAIQAEKAKKIYAIAVPLLAFLVGGSNFVTALTSAVVMALIAVYCAVIRRRGWLIPAIGTVALVAALTIAVISPGNDVRQEYFERMNPVSAVFTSFYYGFRFIELVVPGAVFLAFLCMIPLIYKITKASNFSFRLPPVAVALMYGVYVSTFTPNLFSWSSFGPARVVNINFFAFQFFLLFSLVYCIGSFAQYVKRKDTSAVRKRYAWLEKPAVSVILAICFVASCVYVGFTDADGMISISATRSLVSGEARVYHEEFSARLEILQNPEIREAELPVFSVTPHVLFHALDITPDPTFWTNTAMARFYDKDTVILVPRGD
ncbi:MAG: DUF6056 family protein [Defluviitaleaceae bacterium]|nr:DUF6056 family protein [Defluviitaleaceae bacterium]